MASIEKLPIEILAQVFKFVVKDPGMVATLLQVCKRWTASLSLICKGNPNIPTAFKLLCRNGKVNELECFQINFNQTTEEVDAVDSLLSSCEN